MASNLAVFFACQTLAATGAKLSTSTSFEQYVASYQRSYAIGSDEFHMRRGIYETKLYEIEAQNSNPNRLWTAGLNHLTDRTEEELKRLRGWRHTGEHGRGIGSSLLETESSRQRVLDAEVDWRNTTSAHNVMDQGFCGSCWAVATAAMLQAHYEIHMGEKLMFSAQELVNCVPNPQECGGTGGCEGATVELAMKYVASNGLSTKEQVPYSGVDEACPKKDASALMESGSATGLAGLQSWETLPSNKAGPLLAALQHGPVAISVGASPWSMYSSGIFDSCDKDAIIDHAVLMVGYGTDKGTNYWTVQNSWGSGWGETGFIRVKRGATTTEDDEHCGTDYKPGDGIACKPYPDSVEVCGMCGLLYDSVAPKFQAKSAAKNGFLQRHA